jgi:L-ascorbate metabolism protein UlaG (beta-lactamase superfamily)
VVRDERRRENMSKTKITWLGHASVKVEGADSVVFFDPWIDGNPACSLKIDEIKRADAVCVTHGHNDHIGDSIEIVKRTKAPLICSPEIGFYAEKYGVTYDKGSIPLNVGGSWETDRFTITMVNAVHTSDIMGQEWKENGIIMPGSGSVGYVIEFKGGPSIYYGGDTGVFGDMAIIRDLYSPEVAVLPAGGKYNMGVREAGYAASLIHPKFFLPIHYDTFPNQTLDLGRLEAEIVVRAPHVKLVRWRPSETFEYA